MEEFKSELERARDAVSEAASPTLTVEVQLNRTVQALHYLINAVEDLEQWQGMLLELHKVHKTPEGAGSPSIRVCCSEMLCDLIGVNDAFPHGFYWEDTDGEPLRLYEWLSDKEGDTREVERCGYCERVPLQRRVALVAPQQPQGRP